MYKVIVFLLLISDGGESPAVAVLSCQHTQHMVFYGPLLVRGGSARLTVSCWREQRYSIPKSSKFFQLFKLCIEWCMLVFSLMNIIFLSFFVSWCNGSAHWLHTFCGIQGSLPAMEMDWYDDLHYFLLGADSPEAILICSRNI